MLELLIGKERVTLYAIAYVKFKCTLLFIKKQLSHAYNYTLPPLVPKNIVYTYTVVPEQLKCIALYFTITYFKML